MAASMSASRRLCPSIFGAAVFREHRPDALMHARLCERMRHDGRGEEEQREEEEQLQRHQTDAGLQTHAEDQESDAEGFGHAGRVHAGEDIGHSNQPERPHDGEERSEENQRPAQDVDKHHHELGSTSLS